MIAIVNYGSGNVQAVANIYTRQHVPFVMSSSARELAGADHYLLPGVGAFDQCMQALNASGMRDTLEKEVVGNRKPVIGICVGMQLLARSSEEGSEQGLGWIDGSVKKFDPASFHQATHLPHMGWNTVEPAQQSRIFEGVDLAMGYYFLHSYYFACDQQQDVLAVTEYGGRFACAVHRDNVYGVQFHPEKSHQPGIRLLQNFATL
jgi:imidazole glycerol-phosphate synthase subunit HisH